MNQFQLRHVDAETFATAIDWAAAEGWNPGLDDLAAFHDADPGGFIMGFVENTPVSSISVVKYGDDFGFLGFYIVHPEYRGTGLGLATWNAGMTYLEGRMVGLDGVVAQQDNYRKSGFVLAGRNIRYTGVPALHSIDSGDLTIRPVDKHDLPSLEAYDAMQFATRREAFISEWTIPADSATRRSSLGAFRGSTIVGFGTVRACRSGYKVGPLFADDEATAAKLFHDLVQLLPKGTEVSLDTPEDNSSAVRLAIRAKLEPVFETARMYRGDDPGLPLARIFGVTTFELG